jgi:uncharacterized membrane protein YkoI
MMNKIILLAAVAVVGLSSVPAVAYVGRNEQEKAREQTRSGQELKLRDIESRVLPRMKGMEYLGPEYDPEAKVYRLKFINGGRVIFVDVDARTGAILHQR